MEAKREAEGGVIEIQLADAKPVIELWDQLPERERATCSALVSELRETVAAARTPEEARSRSLAIIERESANQSSTIPEFLKLLFSFMRKHAWNDRTWAEVLIFLSLIATFPVSGKAAGLAALGSAVRVAIPVVGMAAAALVGSALDSATNIYSSMIRRRINLKKGTPKGDTL